MNIEVMELLAEGSPRLEANACSELRTRADSGSHDATNSRIVTATLVGHDEHGRPLVVYPPGSHGAAIPVRSAIVLEPMSVGRQVLMVCEGQESSRFVVIGVLQPEGQEFALSPPVSTDATRRIELDVDGQRVEIVAEQELVLRCGKASLTLCRNGKIVIRGEEIVSRANGANRIQGGSIQLN
ncbi:MAG TPA: DUF6484 domain-containing protein [Nitrospiraceae bacterium]|nr:DUF6484 domain-containing protein [Nitrospiraceae bacterium]